MSYKQSLGKGNIITNSLERLNRAASQGRFRIKSLRVKTMSTDEQKCLTERDYQGQLSKLCLQKSFLKSLYIIRCQQTQTKPSDSKYLAFIKNLHQKIFKTNSISISQLNFQKQACQALLKQLCVINKEIISYDLSKCSFLSGYDQKSANQWIIQSIVTRDKRIAKLVLSNMGLNAIDISKIFDLVIYTQKIFYLDISNQNSQSMNRFGQSIDILYQFFKRNQTTSIVYLDNLSLRKIGVQHIYKGITANLSNPLKVLNIKNNAISEQASLQISLLARSGLISLDISQNPLGPNFYLSIPSWKLNTVRNLNLSSTNMNSQALIFFLSRLQQNKALQILKLDRNDFSHHWFNQIKQMLEVNTSLESISLAECKIKRVGDAFAGLNHNRYMKRINISYNHFQQGVKQICEMIKQNRMITEIRLKFCGLKTPDFIKIFQALIQNEKILLLDISENQLGDEGAKQILKTLSRNSNLSTLITEKVQIPFNLKQQIEQKIQTNKNIKKARQLNTLKKQNKVVKKNDLYSWNDVEELQQKIIINNNTLSSIQAKVTSLQKQYEGKKIRFQQIMKQCQSKQQQLSSNISQLYRKIKDLQREQQNVVKKFKLKEQGILNSTQQEQKNIKLLQQLILQQSQKNQYRQNELQDQYQNLKYIQKKKEVKKQSDNKKTGFDTFSAVNSKRKNKNT